MAPMPGWFFAVAIATGFPLAIGIGCFVCTSINHDNPECEDTFNFTRSFYDPNCWATRRDRIGRIPARVCVKMTGSDEETGFSVTVRDCVVDKGATSSETEIGNQIQCGLMNEIEFNGLRMRGCIISCDSDACNAATALGHNLKTTCQMFVIILVAAAISNVQGRCLG